MSECKARVVFLLSTEAQILLVEDRSREGKDYRIHEQGQSRGRSAIVLMGAP